MTRFEKGLGMWVMSKTVLFIFLLLLVAMMTGFLNIYQNKVVEDSARNEIMLWAEAVNSVLQFRVSSMIWPVSNKIEIKSAGGRISEARDYTVGIKKVETGNDQRLAFMLTWKDWNATKISDITEYATAVSVTLPNEITNVYFFNGSINPGGNPTYLKNSAGESINEMVVRPSAEDTRDAYIVVYRNKTVLCIGTIKQTETNLTRGINNLITCCSNPGSC